MPGFAWRHAIVISLTTYAAISLGYILPAGQLRSMLWWLPAGIAAAFLLRWGNRHWIWVAAGAAAAGLVPGHSWQTIGVSALVTALGPLSLATYLGYTDFRRDFTRRRDIVRFAAATPIAMLLPATLKLLYVTYAGLVPADHQPVEAWLQWWLNATIGTLAIAPAVVSASWDTVSRLRQQPFVTTALIGATILFATLAALVPPALHESCLFPVGILIVVASTVRTDLTFTGALALAIAGSAAASLGASMLPSDNSAQTTRLWAYCVVLTGLTLILRALLAEREAAEQRLRDAEAGYRRQLLDAARREQERLGRDMHDALGQELTGIALMARNIELRAGRTAPDLVTAAHELSSGCARAAQAARSIARGLLLPGDLTGDLATALRQLAARVPASAGVAVSAHVVDGLTLSEEVTTSLYRITQEALNNALKHSHAAKLRISLTRQGPDQARLCIEDDGVGTAACRFDDEGGLGLQTMRYRAELIGGQFACESAPGRGTRITCTVRIVPAESASEEPADSVPHWTQRRAS